MIIRTKEQEIELKELNYDNINKVCYGLYNQEVQEKDRCFEFVCTFGEYHILLKIFSDQIAYELLNVSNIETQQLPQKTDLSKIGLTPVKFNKIPIKGIGIIEIIESSEYKLMIKSDLELFKGDTLQDNYGNEIITKNGKFPNYSIDVLKKKGLYGSIWYLVGMGIPTVQRPKNYYLAF